MGKPKQDPLQWPRVPEKAKKRVMELLEKGEISTSEETDKFATEFRQFIGTKYGIPMMNGTSALYSAFFAIGIQPGDEVICPTYTYWATAMPAAALGAKIVFCESDPISFNIDSADIRKKITSKTKAIVPVHLWGYPCEMNEIMEIANARNLFVIEDASHAHGALYRGKKVGSIGDIGCFSFQATKVMPAGEGGMLLTNDESLFEKATVLGHYERTKQLSGDLKRYGNTGFGFKFRMSPLHAAIGRAVLEDYPRQNAIITRNAIKMRRALAELPGFINDEPPSYIERVHYENVMDYHQDKGVDRKKLLGKLEHLNVSGSRYPLLHQQPYFVEKGSDPNAFPITDALLGRLMRFPNYRTDDSSALEEFLKKVKEIYNKCK